MYSSLVEVSIIVLLPIIVAQLGGKEEIPPNPHLPPINYEWHNVRYMAQRALIDNES